MNKAIIWSPAFSVQNHDIDLQHRKLLDTANMVRSLAQNGDKDVVLAALDEAIDYTLTHFAFEEQAMVKADYPEFERHKRVHDQIRASVRALAQDREVINPEKLDDVMTRLIEHILSSDMEYAGKI